MDHSNYWLAQVNIASMHAPLDDPLMKDFVARLDEINALADASPGFIWRLQTEQGGFTDVRAYDDAMILFNMSVWSSIDALRDYVYRSSHREVLRRRRDWFEKAQQATTVLWWINRGHTPTLDEGKHKLAFLRSKGPTPEAFTFRSPYAPEDVQAPT